MQRFWKVLGVLCVVGIFYVGHGLHQQSGVMPWEGAAEAQLARQPAVATAVGTYQFFRTGLLDAPRNPPYQDICRGNTITGEIQIIDRNAQGDHFQWDTLLVLPPAQRR